MAKPGARFKISDEDKEPPPQARFYIAMISYAFGCAGTCGHIKVFPTSRVDPSKSVEIRRNPRGAVKTNEQIIAEITALMADAWLAACDRRVIVGTLVPTKFLVIDHRPGTRCFGPAGGDECRLFVHRSAALDVLRALGTERVAGAAMVAAANGEVPALNG